MTYPTEKLLYILIGFLAGISILALLISLLALRQAGINQEILKLFKGIL